MSVRLSSYLVRFVVRTGHHQHITSIKIVIGLLSRFAMSVTKATGVFTTTKRFGGFTRWMNCRL